MSLLSWYHHGDRQQWNKLHITYTYRPVNRTQTEMGVKMSDCMMPGIGIELYLTTYHSTLQTLGLDPISSNAVYCLASDATIS